MDGAHEAGCCDVSVVLPVYNEAACIEATLREVAAVVTGLQGRRGEVIAVDDGSTDGTSDILRRLAGELPVLRVLRLTRNSGQSAAFHAGFRAARGVVLVTMDADGQNDPADIPRMLEKLSGCDLCCGVRVKRRDSFSRRVASRIGNGVRNAVMGESVTDTGCSLKAFRRELTERLGVWDGMHRFYPALFAMQGARITEIPVNHRPRAGGQSKYTNWKRLRKTVKDLFGVRWLRSRYRNAAVEVVK